MGTISSEKRSAGELYTLDGTPISNIHEGSVLRWVDTTGKQILADVVRYHGMLCVDVLGEKRLLSEIISDVELLQECTPRN